MNPERTMSRSAPAPALADVLPVGLIHARDEQVIYCNEAFANLVGEPIEAVLGRSFFQFVAPEHVEQARMRYAARQHGAAVPDASRACACAFWAAATSACAACAGVRPAAPAVVALASASSPETTPAAS